MRCGSISGHVEDTGGAPIAGIWVQAIDSANGIWIAGAPTNASGDYLLSALPAGSYWVKTAAERTGFNYQDEWYDNANSSTGATAVPVTIYNDTGDINFVLGRLYAVQVGGEVYPVNKVAILAPYLIMVLAIIAIPVAGRYLLKRHARRSG